MSGYLLRGILLTLCVSLLSPSSLQAQTRFPLVPESAERIKLEATLDSLISCNFIDAPLDDVMDELGLRYQITVNFRSGHLLEAGISAQNAPITKKCNNRPLREFLTNMLADLSLVWLVEGDVIHITTPEDAEGRLQTVVYPVGDVIRMRTNRRGAATTPDFDSLIELITSTLSPNSWDEVGGAGSVSQDEQSLSLVVSQTYEVQVEVHNLLNTLRAVRQSQINLPPAIVQWHAQPQLTNSTLTNRRGSSSVSIAKLTYRRPSSTSYARPRTSTLPLQSWQQPQIHSK